MKPLLVFDLDGTLADTAGDLVGALNAVIVEEGLSPVALADVRKMVGAGARALVQRAYAAQNRPIDDATLERLFVAFLAWYDDHIADETRLFPGVVAALDRFEAAGFAFAICTNKVEFSSRKLLAALGIADRFAAICGQDTFAIAKPDPRILTLTIARASGAVADSVMIGDSGADIATAKAAGVPVVAVDFGYTDRPVETFGPDRVISHFDALDAAVAAVRGTRQT
jgi:phosphoglycolate phosphatase